MVKDVLALEINISGAEASSHIYRFLYVRTHGFQSSGQAVPPHRYIQAQEWSFPMSSEWLNLIGSNIGVKGRWTNH